MKALILLVLYFKTTFTTIYNKIDDYEKIYSTNLHRTLQQSPEFVAAISRLQHMKWSSTIGRLPEFQTLKTYLTEVGFDTPQILTFLKSLEDDLLLDQFPQPEVYHVPSFQPFLDNIMNDVSKFELVEGGSVALLSFKDIGEICSNLNGYYVNSLINMVFDHSTTKRMIDEFQDMDLDLEALANYLVEAVSLSCIQLDFTRD